MGAFRKGAIIGFGIGYLQGAKAGRARYDQIKQKVDKIDLDPVKKKVEPVMSKVMAKTAGIKKGSHNEPKPISRASQA